MSSHYRISLAQLQETFLELRRCGNGVHECQVLWVSSWTEPRIITEVVHPQHVATPFSFDLNERWLVKFWGQLGQTGKGVRVQVHTHPGGAFHSRTDDDWPLVHTPGFLSLVIPRFAMGEISLEDAYLAELQGNGGWRRVKIDTRIEVVP